jgi:hypothetical protein
MKHTDTTEKAPLEGATFVRGLWEWRGFVVPTRATLAAYAVAYEASRPPPLLAANLENERPI